MLVRRSAVIDAHARFDTGARRIILEQALDLSGRVLETKLSIIMRTENTEQERHLEEDCNKARRHHGYMRHSENRSA